MTMEPCLTGQLRGEQAADLRSLLDVSALIPLLELRLTPATRTRLQKFHLRICWCDFAVGVFGTTGLTHGYSAVWSPPKAAAPITRIPVRMSVAF